MASPSVSRSCSRCRSPTTASRRLQREIVKASRAPASLQLRARDTDGFDQGVLRGCNDCPASRGGVDPRPARDDRRPRRTARGDRPRECRPSLSRWTAASRAACRSKTARAAGSRAERDLKRSGCQRRCTDRRPRRGAARSARARGARYRSTACSGPKTIGALSGAMAAIAQLRFVQRLTGLSGRVTRILVEQAGADALVRARAARACGRAPDGRSRRSRRCADQPGGAPERAGDGLLRARQRHHRPVAGVQRDAVDGTGAPAYDRGPPHAGREAPGSSARMLLFQALCLGVVASLAGSARRRPALALRSFTRPRTICAAAFRSAPRRSSGCARC